MAAQSRIDEILESSIANQQEAYAIKVAVLYSRQPKHYESFAQSYIFGSRVHKFLAELCVRGEEKEEEK